MRAIRIHEFGGPEVARLFPGQARLKHHAIGDNYLDIYDPAGVYPAPLAEVGRVHAALEARETTASIVLPPLSRRDARLGARAPR